MPAQSPGFDETVDLLVVGSGAGGMTAALAATDAGLDAVVLEAAPRYGGTTATSGGAIWIPVNPYMAQAGVADDPMAASTYLRHVVAGRTDDARLDAYLAGGPDMVRWLAGHDVRFAALPAYADYYPDAPGARPGGRTLEAMPLDGFALGADFADLEPPHPQERIFGRICATAAEARLLLAGGWRGRLLALWLMLRYALDLPARLRGARDRRLTLGNALVGRLRRALQRRGVTVRLNHRVRALIIADERVVGAQVESPAGARRIAARHGVVLACGGFARDDDRRRRHQPAPVGAAWTAALAGDRGDALRMAAPLDAATDLLDDAWWVPTLAVPGESVAWIVVVEKSLPGCLLVDAQGQRFVNEAAPYIDVVHAMLRRRADGAQAVPAWLLFDARFRRRYPCGPVMPGAVQPDHRLPPQLDGWLTRAPDLATLADRLGIDSRGLAATVARFNEHARRGEDPDFGKGGNAYDRYYGDPAVRPNPCLAPLEEAPFYGVRVDPGDLGTKGGLLTDADARVLRTDGSPIAGLYATGNASASVMGHTYPGAGGTIGPAMVFGWRAARRAAAAP